MAFLRIIEVFSPFLPAAGSKREPDFEEAVDKLVRDVISIKSYGELFLVADLKRQDILQMQPVKAAGILKQRAGVEAAPVIVARNSGRRELLSSISTCRKEGLRSVMLVWGDPDRKAEGKTKPGFGSLSEFIKAAAFQGEDRAPLDILAPVSLTNLGTKQGKELAKSRLQTGAKWLLAQPPTTDRRYTLDRHLSAIDGAGLTEFIIPGVFPFRDVSDVEFCEKQFGWQLPKAFHRFAARGRAALLDEARLLVEDFRALYSPGIYLSSRGEPEVVKAILG